MNMSKKKVKVLGKSGENNYVENVPFLIPDENMEWFKYMRGCADKDAYTDYQTYGNAL